MTIVLGYLISFFELISICNIVGICLGKKLPLTTKNFWLSISLGAVLTTWTFDNPEIVNNLAFSIINSLMPVAIFILLVYINYSNKRMKISILVGFLVTAIYFIYQMLSFLLLTPLAKELHHFITFLSYHQIYGIIGLAVLNILLVLIKKFLLGITKDILIYVIERSSKITLIQTFKYFSSLLFTIALVFTISYFRNNVYDFAAIIIAFLFFLLSESKLFTKKAKEYNLEAEMEQQTLYMENYKNILDDVRGFWHSYTNIMQVVSILVSSKEEVSLEELKEVFSQFVDWERINKLGQKIKIINVPHVALGGLLSSKLQKANELGVNMNISSIGDKAINMNMHDLVEIVGVLVDNAIEAAYYTESKNVDVKLEMSEIFTIKVENEFVVENNKTLKYGKSNGVGLQRVGSILLNTKQAKYTVNTDNSKYLAILEVYNEDSL